MAKRAAPADAVPNADGHHILCQVKDISCGFFLIDGPEKLVLQFFRHYGHPVRNQKVSNRLKEVVSMITVCSFIAVYPGALLAFIWAPMQVQWVWLGYLVYTMAMMHLYRFDVCGGKHIATTEARLARELHRHGQFILTDSSGHRVLAELHTETAKKVDVGKRKVEYLVADIFANQSNTVATERQSVVAVPKPGIDATRLALGDGDVGVDVQPDVGGGGV